VIGYLDTSAVVPLIIEEPSSPACRRFWDDADAVVSCRLLYVEAAAALAQASRIKRISRSQHTRALGRLHDLWAEIDVVEIDQTLVEAAADSAHRLALRGYDAVHCASAQQLIAPDLVAATGDRKLLDAWHALGVATYDVNQT
jgi:predicted nucleic acid-binding protein